jgi:hypothetical protein
VTCCAATSALDHQRCDHCATLCERAGRAAEWPRDEPDFDAAVTEWRAAAEIGEETARGVIALAARTQRPQHALHFLAQLRTRTNLARNDDDLLEHLDAAGNVAARHPLTLGGWAARAIRMGFDTYCTSAAACGCRLWRGDTASDAAAAQPRRRTRGRRRRAPTSASRGTSATR